MLGSSRLPGSELLNLAKNINQNSCILAKNNVKREMQLGNPGHEKQRPHCKAKCPALPDISQVQGIQSWVRIPSPPCTVQVKSIHSPTTGSRVSPCSHIPFTHTKKDIWAWRVMFLTRTGLEQKSQMALKAERSHPPTSTLSILLQMSCIHLGHSWMLR